MSSGVQDPPEVMVHPVSGFAVRLHAQLDQITETGLWSMSNPELRAALPALTRAKARVAELELRVLAEADSRALGHSDSAYADTAAWWAVTTRTTRPAANQQAQLARGLKRDHEPVRASLAAGGLSAEQAKVIVDAVDALPTDLVGASVIDEARARLIELAELHDANQLRILGRRILDVVAPEVGEEHQRRQLENEEAQARKNAWFAMRDDGHGQMSRPVQAAVAAWGDAPQDPASPRRAPPHPSHPTPGPRAPGQRS